MGSIVFFFCDKTKRQAELTLGSIYRCLLKQLLSCRPERQIPDAIYKEYETKGSSGNFNEAACGKVIVELGHLVPIILVIDAMDECEKQVRSNIIKDLIFPLLKEQSRLKVLITGRPEKAMTEAFCGALPSKFTRLAIKVQNGSDIKKYVHKKVEKFDFRIRSEIEQKLIEESEGM
ncbi:hypothetical protein AnigIFM63326_001528 [Aspergillus niger]|nr:hypothetical protein AnigIFM63326_001528 [Aspergillus niger]